MGKICYGEAENLANWSTELGKISRGKLIIVISAPET